MKKVALWTALIPLFLIPFIPLYIANDLFFPFITGKGFAFRVLVEIALAGYVLLALVDKRYRPRFSWTWILYAALTVWMFLANLLAVNAHKAFWSNYERMDGWVTLVHVFVFFVILGSVMTADRLWRKWWLFFLSGAALVSIYSLFQLAGMADIHQGGARVDATLGNAAYLAVYMLFVTAVALWQGLESKGWMRYLLLGFAFITAFILFTTETRGAVIGLAGAIGLGSLLWMFEAGKKKTRLIAGGVFLGLLVLVGAFFAFKDSTFIKSDPTLARISSISAADGSTRFTLWSMALEGVAERPVFGWGQEGFNYVFQKHYRPELYAQEPWFDRAHNTYFDWVIAGGIPALLLFLALLASAVFALFQKGASRPERVMLIAALAAYAFQALFVFDNLWSYVPLAALLAAAHAVSSRPWAFFERLPELRDDSASTVATPAIAAIAIGVIWMVNVPSIAAASTLVSALGRAQQAPTEAATLFKEAVTIGGFGTQEMSEQYMTFASGLKSRADVSAQDRGVVFKSALDNISTQVTRIPKDARLRVQYATGLRAAGDFQAALRESAVAVELSPKKQTILLERGFEYWEAGMAQEARDTFLAVYELNPSFKELAKYAAAGEIALGNKAAGDVLLIEAFGTTEVDSEILIVAYYQAKRFDDLIAALKRRVTADGSLESYLRLSSAYVITGRSIEARVVAQEALSKHPEQATTITAFMAQIPN